MKTFVQLLSEANIEKTWEMHGDKIHARMKNDKATDDEWKDHSWREADIDTYHEVNHTIEAGSDRYKRHQEHRYAQRVTDDSTRNSWHRDKFYDEASGADPSGHKNKYLPWIAREYGQGHIKEFEDIRGQAGDLLHKFHKAKTKGLLAKHGLSANIHDYTMQDEKTLPFDGHSQDVIQHPKSLFHNMKKISQEDLVDVAPHEVDKHEDENWKIYIPKTEEASKKYGAGTKWCTAAHHTNYFDSYNNRGNLHIFVPKKPAYVGEKYQFHPAGNELRDETDATAHKKFEGRTEAEPSSYHANLKQAMESPAGLNHPDIGVQVQSIKAMRRNGPAADQHWPQTDVDDAMSKKFHDPNTHEAVFGELSKDRRLFPLKMVLDHPKIGPDAIHAMVPYGTHNDFPYETARALITHPKTTDHTASRIILHHPNLAADVFERHFAGDKLPDTMEHISKTNPTIGAQIAEHPNLDAELARNIMRNGPLHLAKTIVDRDDVLNHPNFNEHTIGNRMDDYMAGNREEQTPENDATYSHIAHRVSAKISRPSDGTVPRGYRALDAIETMKWGRSADAKKS